MTVDGRRVRSKKFIGAPEAVYRAKFVSKHSKWFIDNLKNKLATWEYLERTCIYSWLPKREIFINGQLFNNPDEPLWTRPREVDNPKTTPYSHKLADPMNQAEITEDLETLFTEILNDTPEWQLESENDDY